MWPNQLKCYFTAHTRTIYNETSMAMETKVPVKGSLAKHRY